MTLTQFQERLRAATDTRMTQAALEATTEYGRGLEARARARAPRRSGRLASSVRSSSTVVGQGDVRLETQAGAGLRYGRMQEFGGTVRGNPLLVVGKNLAAGGRGFFTLRARDGRLFLARREGGTVTLAARLSPQVRVPATHFLRNANNQAELKANVQAAIRKVLRGQR